MDYYILSYLGENLIQTVSSVMLLSDSVTLMGYLITVVVFYWILMSSGCISLL